MRNLRSCPSVRLLALGAGGVLLAGVLAAAALPGDAGSSESTGVAHDELTREVDRARRALLAPAVDARDGVAALRSNLADTLQGADRPLAELREERAQLLDSVREAADELEARPPARALDRLDALPVAAGGPALERITDIDAEAQRLADDLREAADSAERRAEAASRLRAATEDYVALSPPATDDPAALAAHWRAEAEALDAYREAAEEVAALDALEPVGRAHLILAEGLAELAGQAVARLEQGDVEGYNALLDERLGAEDPFGFRASLTGALRQVLDGRLIADLDETQGRTIAFVGDLEALRRATSPSRA